MSEAVAARPKRVKPPIEKAEYQIDKQIKAIQDSSLDDRQKEQIVDWLTGILLVMQGISEVVNPDCPPENRIHVMLIDSGRKKRQLAGVLSGATSANGSGDAGAAGAPAPGRAAEAVGV